MAQKLDLLSLPDELLERIVTTAFPHPVLKDWDWITLALTCRRLSKLQLALDLPTISKWECLKWYLKHYQGTKSVRIQVVDWPTDDIQLKELSDLLLEVSRNLQKMKQLEIWPPKHYQETPRCPQALSPWITAMLIGATSLTHLRLGVEMLPCLPMSGRESLESLYIDTKDTVVLRDAIKAVKDYQQLRSLTIVCLSEGISYRTWDLNLHLPELHLQHLVHLRSCHLKYMPAPDRIVLLQGDLELTTLPEYIRTWSKRWHQIQAHVHSITIERYPDSWLFSLREWPEGLDAFHGLQFLQLNCGEVAVDWMNGRDALDLAHIAYIPHVSFWCKGNMSLEISKGGWKVLEVFCGGLFSICMKDAKTFMEETDTFSFTFDSALRRCPRPEAATFIKKLEDAGVVTGNPLYVYNDIDSSLYSAHFNAPLRGIITVSSSTTMMEVRNCQREDGAVDGVYSKARLEWLTGP